jgi:hypothetical protein
MYLLLVQNQFENHIVLGQAGLDVNQVEGWCHGRVKQQRLKKQYFENPMNCVGQTYL